MKSIYEGILNNSFALIIFVALVNFIAIVFGSLIYTTTQQMIMIMTVLYSCCRLYQSYRRSEDKEFSLLGGKNLEKLFLVLTMCILVVSIYVDACSVVRL